MKWSWSFYDAYGTCARKLFGTRISKQFVEPETEYQVWGIRVHEALEHAVRDGVPLPEEMKQWEPLVAKLRGAKGDVHCELELGITQRLEPCDFHAEDVWCRGIIDVAIISGKRGVALDYKTGKRKLTDQLKLMALLMFAHFPELEEVHTGFAWLKLGSKIDREVYRRSDLAKLWRGFLPRLEQIKQSYKLGIWPAKSSGLCRNHCADTACSYNGNYVPPRRNKE